MNQPTSLPVLTAQQTADMLPFKQLCQVLSTAAIEYQAGQIASPERQVLPLAGEGVLLSMPATARDIGMHKLVNVCPANSASQLPTINGIVSVYDAATGLPLLVLDGPTVTARRTAAVSMLAISLLHPAAPTHVSLIGKGKQASGHLEALATLYPGIRVDVHGLNLDSAQAFCQRHAALNLQLQPASGRIAEKSTVVIMLTTSKAPVYNEAARIDRLLIGVGAFKPDMAELGPVSIAGSQLFSDDPAGARHEAGDLIQAGIDWNSVASLADAVAGRVDPGRPVIFKSVGTAAWDLAAARCALQHWQASHPANA
ncbi:bifunctional Delta(1)-pyrroline-2-carboxylate/Delta(1)-piperideine-2-carboxylate reductase [Aquitalea sp.]|uniref:bifunctional Delta(1)-pyrroline-2-carboxylate/Delta(1)-piperideine-2- carboxylate reductase n=1 Tax=Aquitalea sp. TaxID=1872623 RepID=UPI00258D5AC7|nr:bifunctional Delta(1)-pyrroline-2-carboxylate/Delta(1)-piperideine-2-carboxylate reductase [Aquitalea sp.]